jgi:uncharacterized membrane protein
MFRITTHIDAPAEAIWPVLSDVAHWPDWTPTIQRVDRRQSGPLAVGHSAKVKQPKLPAVVWTVSEVREGRSFMWSSKGGGFTTVGDHRIEPAGDGCDVTLSITRSGPLAGLADRLFRGIDRRYVTTEGESLRRFVEARAAA